MISLANINIGSGPGVGDGDPLRTAFSKINQNFANIQSNLNANVTVPSVSSLTNGIYQLNLDPTGNTYVPKNLTVVGSLTVNGNVTTVNQEIINSTEIVAGNLTANLNLFVGGNITSPTITAITANSYQQQALIGNLQASAYSNVNVIAYLAGNITVGNIASNGANIAGIILANNSIYSWQLSTDIQFGQLAATANIVMNRNVIHNRDLTVNGNITANNGNIANITFTNNSIYSSQLNQDIQFGQLAATANIVMNRNTVLNKDLNVIANVTANNITLSGNITGNVNGYALGYRDVPQVTSANVTFALTDGGKHYYSNQSAPNTWTVPANANVAFPVGTAISLVNQGSANISVALQANVTMYLAGNSTSSTRTLTSYGMATVLKVSTNTWFINGTGVV
jgi:hypothetical protein